jgi:hypothetical protein
MEWLKNTWNAIASWGNSDAWPEEKIIRSRPRSPPLSEEESYQEDVPRVEGPAPSTQGQVQASRRVDHSAQKRRAIVSAMSKDQQNTVIFAMYSGAVQKLERKGRSNFNKEERAELLQQIEDATGVHFDSMHALQLRIYRMDEKETPLRAPGSGAPEKWTPEMVNVTKDILRSYGGEVSGSVAYDDYVALLGPSAIARSTFYGKLANKDDFKTRAHRTKPSLTDHHKALRVDFARNQLALTLSESLQRIYIDEKLFQAYCQGKLLLPAEDDTPTKFVQSKSNMTQVMVLVALMKPRRDFNGVVGAHTFTERHAAKNNSRHREAGVIEHKTVNVSAEQYLLAFETSLLPTLKRLVEISRLQNSVARPFVFQDDNAKPHRGHVGGILVHDAIVKIALEKFGLYVEFSDPAQPPQSPDTNPLDQFFFRLMYTIYRRLRAQARVKRLLEGAVDPRAADEMPVGILDDENDENDNDVDDEAFLRQPRRVPLRCCRPEAGKSAKCAGCLKPVRDSDMTATQCDLRGSWWHRDCALAKLEEYGHVRGVDPQTVAEEDPWYCPQCAYHLCRGTHATANLCVICGEPSKRDERVGSDMVTCDSAFCGLFHKSCVRYEEWERDFDDEIEWRCPVCCVFLDLEDGSDELREIDTVDVSENTVAGIKAAIMESLKLVDRDAIEKGFETRKHFLQAIIDSNGGNTYEKHWRRESK